MRTLRRLRSNHGGSRIFNLILLAGVGSAAYFGIMYVPVYAELYEMRSLIQDVGNQNWKHFNEEATRKMLMDKAKGIGAVVEMQNAEEVHHNGIILLADDVAINNDEQAKTLTIQVRYLRGIKYPFLEKYASLEFNPVVVIDTTKVTW
jgi:hypothetical protein